MLTSITESESRRAGSLFKGLALWFGFQNTNSERACLHESAVQNDARGCKALSAPSESSDLALDPNLPNAILK